MSITFHLSTLAPGRPLTHREARRTLLQSIVSDDPAPLKRTRTGRRALEHLDHCAECRTLLLDQYPSSALSRITRPPPPQPPRPLAPAPAAMLGDERRSVVPIVVALIVAPLGAAALAAIMTMSSAFGGGAANPRIAFLLALAAGLVGNLVCGTVVSLSAASYGGLALAVTVGSGYAWLLSQGGATDIAASTLGAAGYVIGGVGGIIVPSAAFVGAFVCTLAILGVAMGQAVPRRVPALRRWDAAASALYGATVGGATLGLLMGVRALLNPWLADPRAVALATGLSCGLAMLLAASIVFGRSRKTIVIATVEAALVAGAVLAAFASNGTTLALTLATAAHVAVQGTAFALSFVVANHLAGRTAGVVACLIEGCLGYLGFIAVTHFAVVAPALQTALAPVLVHIHLVAFGVLVCFVVTSQVAHSSARRSDDIVEIQRRYDAIDRNVGWVPPLAAVSILASGLALIESRGQSISQGWLFSLIAIFAFQMAEGIGHYTPFIRRLAALASRAITDPEAHRKLQKRMTARGDNFWFRLHTLSLPVLYLLAAFKPPVPAPLQSVTVAIENATGTHFVPALLLWATVVATVVGIRFITQRRVDAAELPAYIRELATN